MVRKWPFFKKNGLKAGGGAFWLLEMGLIHKIHFQPKIHFQC
jgi:hypothetical protein